MASPVPAQPSLLDHLNPRQREAVEAVRGPVCILAGAGSGKTATITYRIAHQVLSGVARPDQVLAVTFTERAARELRERLARLGLGRPVRAATFHAAAWAQLRYFWPSVSDSPLPEVLASKVRLLVPAARRLRVEARDLATEIEWAKARRLDPDGYAAAAGGRTPVDVETMVRVYREYEQEKTRRNEIDYEDMLLRMTALLEQRDDLAAVVRERYRFLTVDEFQDVNPAQWALLRAWLGDNDEVCVVGDDDQTIYSFTGATAAYLTGFQRHYPRARVVTLTQNYRSTREVLDLANRILWTKPAPRRKHLVTRRRGGAAPVFREFTDAEAETEGVVAEVRRLLTEGVAAGEVAICYRVNAQSQAYEEALRDAGVPFVVRGEGGFFDRPEVRQALRQLQDAAAAGPGRDRGDPPPPGDAAPARPPRADREVERVLRDRLSWHPRREPDGAAARERWRNLGTLVELAANAVQARADVTLAEVVADLVDRAAAGHETAAPDGAVTLLTLHKAKGLEFDAVFLVALEEGLLPISHARDDAAAVEEERRLLYVGVTRARRHLWLSWARSRPGFRGNAVPRRPSRFLYNLGPGAPRSGGRPSGPDQPAAAAGGRRDAARHAPPDDAVTGRLRAWRLQRARADDVPAFVVFNDRTLASLATQRPRTHADLLAVHGLGPAKVARYGDAILEVLTGDGEDP